MQLASVRELKQTAVAGLFAPRIEVYAAEGAMMGSDKGVVQASRRGRPPRIAVGIAPSRTAKKRPDYALAIHVASRTDVEHAVVRRLIEQAKKEADVRVVGKTMKLQASPWYRQAVRPVKIGSSVAHPNVTAGTLGWFARKGKHTGFVSNNHILAAENAGSAGDPILQPGPLDGGDTSKRVAALDGDYPQLDLDGINLVDCAFAILEDQAEYALELTDAPCALAGVVDQLDQGMEVMKLGRTTGLTTGRVVAFELDNILTDYSMGSLRFDGQISIEGSDDVPFSRKGDSGALVFGKDGRSLAMVFAGTSRGGENGKGLTYATPLGAVIDALGVEFITT